MSSSIVFGQLSGVKTIPVDYASISAFVTDANLQGIGAGGVTLNGRQLYDDATQEMLRLEDKLRNTYELPVDFFVG